MLWMALACSSPGPAAEEAEETVRTAPEPIPEPGDGGYHDGCTPDPDDGVFCVTVASRFRDPIQEIRIFRHGQLGAEEPMWELLRADLDSDRMLSPDEEADYPVWEIDQDRDGAPDGWDAEVVSRGMVAMRVYNVNFDRYRDRPWYLVP